MRPSPCFAVLLTLLALPAQAAMTPEQVWEGLQDLVTRAPGASLSAGSEVRQGDALILSDVVATLPSGSGTATATMPLLTLRQMPDGTVEATPDAEVRLIGTGTGMDGRVTEAEGTVKLSGASARIGGTPGNLTVAPVIAALEGTVAITDPSAGNGASKGNPTGESGDIGTVALSGATIAGTLTLAEAPGAEQVVKLTVGEFSAEVNGIVPEGSLLFSSALSGLDVDLAGKLMGGLDEVAFPGGSLTGKVGLGSMSVGYQMPLAGGEQMAGSVRFGRFLFDTDITAGAQAATDAVPEARGAASLKLAELAYSASGMPDVSGGLLDMSLTARDNSVGVSFFVPAMPAEASLPEALEKGFAVSVQSASGPTDQSMSGTGGELPLSFTLGSEGGTAEFALSRAGLIADLTNKPMTVSGVVPDLGLPFDASLKELALRLAMPLAPGPEAQPFVVRLRLVDLAAADALWDMFDSGRLLARTPAALIADASGTARVTGDMAESDGGDVPIEPVTLDLTDLRATFGGAEVTGKGALTFAMEGETAIPAGTVSLRFTGVYGLLGKLGELGLLPPDAAMGVRGALAAIGKPAGDDRLTSEIEFRPDGTVLANGAPVPF